MAATNVVAPARSAQRRVKWLRTEWLDGWLFASPFVLGFLAFTAVPMVYSIVLVFLDWDLVRPPVFAGLDNFARLVADPLVGVSLYNTAYYTFLSVPLHLVGALLLALALNQPLRGVAAYRTAFYLPSICPAVASAVIWSQILNPDFGILNDALAKFGVGPVLWLFDPVLAKPAFILMSLWTIGGPQTVIFLAGLQSVPEVLHEAAQVDGANTWQRFRNVTLPMLTPTIFFNLVVGVIGSFQVFTAAFIMTSGGPQNATLFVMLNIYFNAFNYSRYGYAAAMAWVLFVILVALTVLQFRLSRRWVYYEVR